MSELSDSPQPRFRRRQWLAAGGAIGAAVATVAALPVIRNATPATTSPQPLARERGGYELTQHVLRYYQTTRI